jgi:hypothetical protein
MCNRSAIERRVDLREPGGKDPAPSLTFYTRVGIGTSAQVLGSAGSWVRKGAEAMTDVNGTVTLPLNCAKCGGGINLWCEGWIDGGQAQPFTFACPSCGVDQRAEIPATRVSPSLRDDNLAASLIVSTIISSL